MQQFDRIFEQGGNDDGMVLSKKADPNIILNLAEQRVQSALERFAADKTVRMPTYFSSNSASSRRVEYVGPGVYAVLQTGQKVMGIPKHVPSPVSLCLSYMSRTSVMNFPIRDLGARSGPTRPELMGCHWQGLVDYALAPAGGRVISHSQLYPRPDDPTITTWSQIGAALVPGAVPAVHPKADKVAYLHALPGSSSLAVLRASAMCIQQTHVHRAFKIVICSIRDRPHDVFASKPHMHRASA